MGNKPTGPRTYEVGRGKPPRHSRYPSGRSGNPGGRRKGSVNLKTILNGVLGSEITASENGKPRTVTVAEALFLSSVKNGLKGHQRAIEYALDKLETLNRQSKGPQAELDRDDEALLNEILRAHRSRSAASALPKQSTAAEGADDDAHRSDHTDDGDADERRGSCPSRHRKSKDGGSAS